MSDKANIESKNKDLPNSQLIFGKDIKLIAKAILILVIVCVFSYKILVFNTDSISVDFATLISVLLALFSIAMSVAFYHMANLSSQNFYSDSFKFTKDIAESLAKIDSGFGEKLNSLDTNYRSMKDEYKTYTLGSLGKSLDQKDKIEEKEENVRFARDEQNKLIDQLITKANLNAKESEDFKKMLMEKEQVIGEAQREISQLNSRLNRYKRSMIDLPAHLESYFRRKISNENAKLWMHFNNDDLYKAFRHFLSERGIHKEFIQELKEYEIIDNENHLTRKGVRLIKNWLNNMETHQ